VNAPHKHQSTPRLPIGAQQMARRIAAAREDERVRIARDLHDHLGQQLTALRLILEHHLAECHSPPGSAVGKALSLAREIDAEIDSLTLELRPGVLDDDGLAASLRQLVERSLEYGLREADCRCVIPRGRLLHEVELAAYRVAQEALHNVLKHARATCVSVTGELTGHALDIIVQDNGVGFDPAGGGTPARNMGLRGMRERAALMRGTLEVRSVPGSGTTVRLRIPDAVTPLSRGPLPRRRRRVSR
jgi:two-component system, chemotaxis family, sensor kinase Cph1